MVVERFIMKIKKNFLKENKTENAEMSSEKVFELYWSKSLAVFSVKRKTTVTKILHKCVNL